MHNGRIRDILRQINFIQKKYKDLAFISGEDFNIFQIIGAINDEVKVHSSFIATLLNPKGCHGQGSLFLDLFVRQFSLSHFQTDGASVTVEKYIGVKDELSGGRLDICLTDKNGENIIIENKIYATDQENQLIRYASYKPLYLFYLTLDGHEPTENSCGTMVAEKDYFCISYRYDILQWLEACRKESATIPLLREGISHYINLIRYLTGQTSSKIMKNEILATLTETPDTLKAARDIHYAFIRAKQHTQCQFWKTLLEELTAQGIHPQKPEWDYGHDVWRYYNSSKNNTYYGISCLVGQLDNTTKIYWRCEIEHNIYVGFVIEQNGNSGVADQPIYKTYRDFLKQQCDTTYQSSKRWLGWKYTTPILNFKKFDSDEMFQLTDQVYLYKIIHHIVNQACEEIKSLKERLPSNT